MGGSAVGASRALAGLVLSLGLAAPASAGVYKYVDESGVVHFTDAPADRRFRKVELPAARVRFNIYHTGGAYSRKPRVADQMTPAGAESYDGLIAEVASRHGVPAALVKAVIAAESAFDSKAVSSKGAQGLMQLMPSTADMLGVHDPFEPRANVAGGVRYLRQLLDRFGDPVWAVAAYNAGPETVDKYGGIPPYPETQHYVRQVMAYYRDYDGDLLR